MAPEQLSGGVPDARSDLFSLGVMLYSMLTGFRPFQGNTAETVCFKVMNVEPVPVTSFQAGLHPELDRIVSRAIAKDPRDRYPSGSEMAEDIRAFVQNASSLDDTSNLSGRLSRRGVATQDSVGSRISGAFVWQAALIVLLTGGALSWWQLTGIMREAEAVAPPPISIPQAPSVQKPIVAKVSMHNAHPRLRAVNSEVQAPAAAMSQKAKIRIEILHHFSAGKASVWIDDNLVFDQELHGDTQRHPVFRALEMNQVANLEFAPGKHTLQVRVIAPGSDYDQTEKIDADLSVGTPRVLLVNCDKRQIQVDLR